MRWTRRMNLYKYWLASAFVVLLASQLAGCSATLSRNFVRPSSEEFVLGKTRYSEIIAKHGTPSDEHMVRGTNPQLRNVSYTYIPADEGAVTPGIRPVRSMAFFFYGDVLVADSFYSTLKSDHTDFDETKISKIHKGKTKLNEVVALLGRPAQRTIDPLQRNKDKQKSIGYHFSTVTDSIFLKITHKQLTIDFNADDLVTDVQFEVRSGN